MTKMHGVVIGIVTEVDDPDGQARIRVKFPWLADDATSSWVPIARPMAGNARGFYFMPEVDDEVLLAFEHGSFDHPFVIGFLHNGVDVPPDDGIDPKVRRLKTVSGHVLDFDDRGGKERVILTTHGNHHLDLDDAGGAIEIKTAGGQTILMKDTPGKIELATKSGTKVTLNDLPSSIEVATIGGASVTVNDTSGVSVSAPIGNLEVSCLSATITASSSCTVSSPTTTVTGGMLSVNSGLASFSGVVQCSTLIANSVVATSYTPGAGNIW